MLMIHTFLKLLFKLLLVLHKNLYQNILLPVGQIFRQLFSRLLQVLFTGLRQNGRIIYFHIQTVFIISVLDKDQVVLRHPCL